MTIVLCQRIQNQYRNRFNMNVELSFQFIFSFSISHPGFFKQKMGCRYIMIIVLTCLYLDYVCCEVWFVFYGKKIIIILNDKYFRRMLRYEIFHCYLMSSMFDAWRSLQNKKRQTINISKVSDIYEKWQKMYKS